MDVKMYKAIMLKTSVIILFCLFTTTLISAVEETTRTYEDITEEILVTVDDEEPPVEEYSNVTIKSGDQLWDSLLNECTKTYELSCIQKNVYSYIDSNMEYPGNVNITDSIVFKPNYVDYSKYSQEANEIHSTSEDKIDDSIVDIEEEEVEGDSERAATSPLEEVTNAFYEKGAKFMMTHDLQLQMPDTFFYGSLLKVSPRGFEGNGVLVKLEMIPREIVESESRSLALPKIFKKKISKIFNQKLLMSFLSLMVILKLIKMKLMFVLPVLVGVGTAKKIILKVLLFFFPFLAHLFKLCTDYHENYSPPKFHHHHHAIAHVHHQLPSHVIKIHKAHHHSHHHPLKFETGPSYPGSELNTPPHIPHPPPITSGISLHHAPEIHVPQPEHLFQHEQDHLEFSGPGLGPEYISNRNSDYFAEVQGTSDVKIPWQSTSQTLHASPSKKVVTHVVPPGSHKKLSTPAPLTKSQIEELALKAEKEVMLKSRLQQEKLRLQQENIRLAQQLKAHENFKLQQQLKLHDVLKSQERLKLGEPSKLLQPKLPPYATPQHSFTTHNIKKSQQLAQASQHSPYVVASPSLGSNRYPSLTIDSLSQNNGPSASLSSSTINEYQYSNKTNKKENNVAGATQINNQKANSKEYDAFYSPILEKIDAIFIKLGVYSEGCRERLICSMYKNPPRYSPHSNLLSNELSRDPKELQKPVVTNAPVIRFYRYIQAARDGQEKNDCLKLYTSCPFPTER